MKMAVLWVLAACSLVEVYQRFKVLCCLHHQGITLMMEAARISEMLVNFYQTIWHYNPEYSQSLLFSNGALEDGGILGTETFFLYTCNAHTEFWH
jgi:hypothetical protein